MTQLSPQHLPTSVTLCLFISDWGMTAYRVASVRGSKELNQLHVCKQPSLSPARVGQLGAPSAAGTT